MSSARDEILARIRVALRDVPPDERPEDVSVPRDYLEQEPDATVERFVERVTDYGASVRTVAAAELAVAPLGLLRGHRARALSDAGRRRRGDGP